MWKVNLFENISNLPLLDYSLHKKSLNLSKKFLGFISKRRIRIERWQWFYIFVIQKQRGSRTPLLYPLYAVVVIAIAEDIKQPDCRVGYWNHHWWRSITSANSAFQTSASNIWLWSQMKSPRGRLGKGCISRCPYRDRRVRRQCHP